MSLHNEHEDNRIESIRQVLLVGSWAVLAFLLGFLVLLGLVFSNTMGAPSGIALALLLGIVLQCFLFSHPAQAYGKFLVKYEVLPPQGFVTMRRYLRYTIYASLILMGIDFLGFMGPSIVQLCVPNSAYIPFRACELFLVYYVFAMLVKRAVYALSSRQAKTTDFVSRYGNIAFLSIFVVVTFLLLFGHLALANFFYFTSSYGLTVCIALVIAFVAFTWWLDRKLSVPDNGSSENV